jgi:bifunctional DNase/RNase
VLKEREGGRSFPILIGTTEALAIDRRLKGVDMPRPMTHDLLAHVIEAMGGSLERIVINDLHDATFIATLYIRQDGQVIEIDSRPSDAIALGVAFETPLFVADHVIEQVMRDALDPNQIVISRQGLEARRDELAEEISELREQIDDVETAESDEESIETLRQRLIEMEAEVQAIEEILRQLP